MRPRLHLIESPPPVEQPDVPWDFRSWLHSVAVALGLMIMWPILLIAIPAVWVIQKVSRD